MITGVFYVTVTVKDESRSTPPISCAGSVTWDEVCAFYVDAAPGDDIKFEVYRKEAVGPDALIGTVSDTQLVFFSSLWYASYAD